MNKKLIWAVPVLKSPFNESIHDRVSFTPTIHLVTRLSLHFFVLTALYFSLENGQFAWSFILTLMNGLLTSFLGWAGAGHEYFHSTAFKSSKLNTFLFRTFSCLSFNNWGWFEVSHLLHHKFTLHSNDPEGPPKKALSLLNLFWLTTIDLPGFGRRIRLLLMNLFGLIPTQSDSVLVALRSKPKLRRRIRVGAAWVVSCQLFILVIGCFLNPLFGLLLLLSPFTFTFTNRNEILDTINSSVESKLTEAYSRQFFYIKYGTKNLSTLAASWTSTTTGTNTNTGYFAAGGPLAVGDFATSNLKYAQPGALIKFTSPDTREFLNGRLVTSGTDLAEDRAWAKVSAVVGDGSNDGAGNLESGIGPITLNDTIPAGAVLSAVFPKFATVLDTALKTDLQDRIEVYEQFGLRYDEENAEWKVITAANLSASSVFSLANAGDATGASLDASWWFKFSTDGNTYTVTYRAMDYIFESAGNNKFHFDRTERIYDYITGKSVKDTVKILKSNTVPSTGSAIGYPIDWQVVDTVEESDGYQDNRKVKVGFYDDDDDGVVDNPDIFDIVVQPDTNVSTKFVFFEKYNGYDNIERYRPYAATNFIVAENESDISLPGSYEDGQLFYFYDAAEDVIKEYDSTTVTLTTNTNYYARKGRTAIEFQYKHHAGQGTRIDPSQTNIVDIYMLERSYDQLYRTWLNQGGEEPTASTSDQLRISYSGVLNPLKGLSDQIVYHPVKYKILFGTQADEEFQATFKVVKNAATNVTNAVIKTRVIQAINEFFALDNFDFGDTFYFTELATYIHNRLAPDLLTVVIVPNQAEQGFGSLFQISGAADEIFISGATVDDVVIIDAIGANQLAASGTVVTSTTGTATNNRSTSAVSSVTTGTSGSGSSTGSSGTGY